MKCKYFPQCGGCQYLDQSESEERTLKSNAFLKALSNQGVKGEIRAFEISPLQSRRRASLSGKRTKKGAILDFLEARSHNIVDIESCLVLTPDILNLREPLKKMTKILGSRSAQLKFHITTLIHGFDLSIQNAKPTDPQVLESLAQIAQNANILRITIGDELVFQSAACEIEIGGFKIEIPPAPFLQATKEAETQMRFLAHQSLSKQKNIADLFSGLGTFSYGLKANVDAFEGSAALQKMMQKNLHQLGIHNIKSHQRDLFREPLSLSV